VKRCLIILLRVVSCRLIQSSGHTPLFLSTVKSLLCGRKDVLSLERVSWARRTKDLLLLAPPFGVVDGVDPVLNLHDDAAVLLDEATAAFSTLGRLDRESTCSFISSYMKGL
jgi:hypothetical protein